MGEVSLPVTGDCLCRALWYESSEPPYDVAYCHCDTCKKALGSVVGVFAFMRGEAFRLTRGEPKRRRTSEVAERGFCAECGTPLLMRYLHDADLGVMVGSHDHPEDWPPTKYHFCIDSKVPWFDVNDDLRRKPFDAVNHQKIAELVRRKLGQEGSDGS